ncbi:MAG TPA: hypothetical protein VJQ82_06430 [Terriglobales bacterium]|nr:hypothetical protein [Terriglobales bacterium]
MAIYLYNLGFSLANAANGNFSPAGNQTGLNQSDTWFVYNKTGVPTWVVDSVAAVQALNPADWNVATMPINFQSNTDYVLVRIFNTDNLSPAPSQFLLRLTAVMGHGTEGAGLPASSLQAPFMAGTKARPVIDCDNSTNPPNWPAATGTDGAWTYCFGMIHGIASDYSCNIGATAYVSNGQYAGFSAYGIDPQLHVVTMVAPGVCDDTAESAA